MNKSGTVQETVPGKVCSRNSFDSPQFKRNTHKNQDRISIDNFAIMITAIATTVNNYLNKDDRVNAVVPDAFLCPVTHRLMEHPYMTMAGQTYEWEAIHNWVHAEGKRTDPLSRQELQNSTLIPNHALRSQIQEWIQNHPKAAAEVRNLEARKPSPAYSSAASVSIDTTQRTTRDGKGLESALKFKSSSKALKHSKTLSLHHQISAEGHVYDFKEGKTNTGKWCRFVRCDGGNWMQAPKPMLFASKHGVIFYDPNEMIDTMSLTDYGVELCKFQNNCTNKACSFAHPFPCKFGVKCRDKSACKFVHPSQDSVQPLAKTGPCSKPCRYSVSCTRKDCAHAHPIGRVKIQRKVIQLFYTHSLELKELTNKKPMTIDLLGQKTIRATKMQFQGDYVFFFTPYPGPWAKEHYKSVEMCQYSVSKGRHVLAGQWELQNHYINCAIGGGKYMVISFWPYEDEAMRAIWEAMRVQRGMEKDNQKLEKKIQALETKNAKARHVIAKQGGMIKKQNKAIHQNRKVISSMGKTISRKNAAIGRMKATIKSKDQYISQQKSKIRSKDKYISLQKSKIQSKDRYISLQKTKIQSKDRYISFQNSKIQRQKREREWARTRAAQRRRRNERFRLLDPIHVLVNEGSASNPMWTLVVDYHKGAHNLEIGPKLNSRGDHQLFITENDKCFEFELILPNKIGAKMRSMLPIVPEKLCQEF